MRRILFKKVLKTDKKEVKFEKNCILNIRKISNDFL